MIKNKKK